MEVTETIQFLRTNALTYCGRLGKLEILHESVKYVETNDIPDVFPAAWTSENR